MSERIEPETWAMAVADELAVLLRDVPRACPGVETMSGDKVNYAIKSPGGYGAATVVLDTELSEAVNIGDRSVLADNLLEKYAKPVAAKLAAKVMQSVAKVKEFADKGSMTVVTFGQLGPFSAESRELGYRFASYTFDGLSLLVGMSYRPGVTRVTFKMLISVDNIPVKMPFDPKVSREGIFQEVLNERESQDQKWGHAFDDRNTANDWAKYISDYAGGAAPLKFSAANFRRKMVQVAALAFAAIETLERNGSIAPRHYD